MTEAERGDEATLFPQTVGARLRAKREALGLSLPEVAARTRVPLRHLEAIEASDYSQLPSPTYAVGFVRAYARAVGGDEVALARDVRIEAGQAVRATPKYEPYEIADPARVPSRGVMIVAAGLALAVLVLALLYFATGLFRGGSSVPPATEVGAPVVAAPVPVASPTPVSGGQVTLAATDAVWLRVYDADNKTLFLGTMKAGDKFDVPAGARSPMINVGRPDKLQVTLNGSNVPALGDGRRPIKDIPVDAASIAARINGASAAAPGAAASPTPTASASVPPAFTAPTPRAAASRASETSARRSNERPRARRSPSPTPSAEGPENLLPNGFKTNP
ncbi:Cytoskeletal protein RodZ [Sphingomonas sp. EC-HK361]|uniref:helix-turn-helix domain-containing protein n=1 Tax=Sphingomonas sp. EC-HK361 TaxID=2038397 RepID=UPI0012561E5C|nr:helix-turn-helix domain-containing protein [Sphingomonas sp. EC-HK361]VVT22159.1 Cytoskeletal protein RodZ [Sphingomonas sp. EC-HK361]